MLPREPRAPWHTHGGQGEEASGGWRGDLAEGTHLPGILGPRALAGEHGSHLKAACSPPPTAHLLGTLACPKPASREAAALPMSAGLEIATLWRVCSKR